MKSENEKRDDIKAKVLKMADLVEYKTASVVSRTVIDKAVGTVTLFAFGEKQGLSEHSAPYDALVYILDGNVEISISGKPYKLKAGEMIIMPANEPHAVKAVTQFKMMLIMIR